MVMYSDTHQVKSQKVNQEDIASMKKMDAVLTGAETPISSDDDATKSHCECRIRRRDFIHPQRSINRTLN
jgi:hypothetical protein